MAETQLPPAFPVSSFLGHPERYYGPAGFNAQPVHAPRGTTPSRPDQSSHGYPILPPLRMHPSTSSHPQSHATQAVPISKLLSDSPHAPPRRNVPLIPQYSAPNVSPPLPPSVANRPYCPPVPDHGFPPPSSRTSNPYHPLTPADSQAQIASFGKPLQSPHYPSQSPSSPSVGSIYSPLEPRSSVSEKQERKTPLSSPVQNVKYTLNMRQQPIAARACGFGERDRRVVDPPPIVDVTLVDKDTGINEEEAPHVYTTLHCTVVHADTLADASQIEQNRHDMAMTQRLMGTCVASPFAGKDELGNKGTFFVFPDLSCRSPGRYRFLFRLIVVDPLHLMVGGSSKIQTQIYSDPFEVYSAKEFPGMRASSALLKSLRKQGLNVAVKKGREATKKSTRKPQAGGDDSEDDEEIAEEEDDDEHDDRGTELGQDRKKRKRTSR